MNTHTINRQIFELKVRSQENAFGLQQQVRAAWDADVMPLLEEMLDEIASPDEVLRIDKLELDLGKIRAEKIGTDMKEKLRDALRTQLLKHKSESVQLNPATEFYQTQAVLPYENSGSQRISRAHSIREMLEYFFTNGVLPWWAGDEFQSPDIDELITESFAKEPVSTWKWMHTIAIHSPAALRRMSLQISPAAQKQILKSARNPVPVYLEKYAGRMAQLLTNSGWTAPLPEETAQLIFTSSLLLQTTETIAGAEEAEAIKVYIKQLSAKLQTPAALLERRIYEGILSYAAKAPAAELKKEKALITHFIEWEKSEPVAAAQISGDETLTLASITDGERLSISEEAERVERILKQFFQKLEMRMELRKRNSSVKKTAKPIRNRSVQAEPEAEIDEKDTVHYGDEAVPQIKNAVSELYEEEKIAVKAKTNTEEGIEESVSVTNETETSSEISQEKVKSGKSSKTEKAAQKKKAVAKELSAKSKSNPKQEEEVAVPVEKKKSNAESSSEIKPELKTEITNEIIPADPLAETIDTEEAFNQEESKQNEEEYLEENKKRPAGMTRYGGLALLGPFISGLFSVLKLVNEKEFISDEARNKAVFLLHYLATGKTKAAEFELSLHKLFCGMKITDTVPRKVNLTAEEKTEAGLFLDDIAEQWPTLQGSSGEAMRNTFMRRNGIIEKKENAWLLRVERNPMDIMLDTLPWSLSIIKMPWMQQALYVEW